MMNHDYISVLKNRQKGKYFRKFLIELLDGLAELSIYIIALLIGLCAFAIFGIENPDEDGAVIVGMLIAGIILAVVFFIYHKFLSKKKGSKAESALQALFPDNISGICDTGSLYNALTPLLSNLEMSNGEILIKYGLDTMAVSKRDKKFNVSFNGIPTDVKLNSHEIFRLALEFSHEMRCDISALVISDAQIKDISPEYITYLDALMREHKIELTECAREYSEPCVAGLQNPADLSCIFYTGKVKTIISFKLKIKNVRTPHRNKKRALNDFNTFKDKLKSCGYTLRDILNVNV